MQQITTLQYNDQFAVGFTNDAWFNATAVAKNYDKRPNDWLSLESTKEYIMALHAALFPEIQLPEKMVIKQNQLLKTKTGSQENGGGAWFHPKLAVAFARWLDVKFAVWCDLQTEKMLFPKRNALVDLPPAYLAPRDRLMLHEAINARCSKTHEAAISYTHKVCRAFQVDDVPFLPAGCLDAALIFLGLKKPTLEDYVLYKHRDLLALEQQVKALPNPKARFQAHPQSGDTVKYIAELDDEKQFAMIPLEKWRALEGELLAPSVEQAIRKDEILKHVEYNDARINAFEDLLNGMKRSNEAFKGVLEA